MMHLAASRVADGRHDLRDWARSRQSRCEAGLEAGACGQRGERGAEQRSGVDQRRQLRPHDRLVTGQQAIDGLIQAFGRGARWQTGSPRCVRVG